MTVGFLRRLPIRQKLMAMIMFTATTVLLLAGGSYLIWEYYRSRGDLTRDLLAQAQLVLDNSAAALQFQDRNAAHETLQTLSVNTHIRVACLYDDKGALFAQFQPRVNPASCPARPPSDSATFGAMRLDLTTSGYLDGTRTGAVYVRSDLQVLRERLRLQALAITVLLVVALGVAWLLSRRLQALVANPLTDLARTASQVSQRGDYSLRARRTTDDEVGALVTGFNRMLEQIQTREGELSRANEDLRREIAERQRAERLKDEFLATLSHELRTPLNAILGWIRLLRADAVPAAGTNRALEKIERNAQAQARLVEDLLEISRITTGKLRLELSAVDLAAVVNAAIESIRPSAEAREVRLVKDFATFSLPTYGDPDRLQQVVWNLLSNAVKFTPAGGEVTVLLRRDGQTDELIVRDTGIGIDPAFLPSVFDTFRQADASATRQHGGLGLGLSIVRRLVDLHGGQVSARSAGAGQGAEFTVRLPVRAAAAREPEPEPYAPGPLLPGGHTLAGRRILVVDDEEDTLDLLQSVLKSAGADVECATGGDEALRLAIASRPEVLLSDIGLPRLDGY
ncbi:MAG TPA: ATP-binding protein [Vicinamibacterales bacterium]|nr:ATP-binding protein [Vicinamibacterales bacterium]